MVICDCYLELVIGCWQSPTLGTHAHGFWVDMGVIFKFMGGHSCDITVHGWAWLRYYSAWVGMGSIL